MKSKINILGVLVDNIDMENATNKVLSFLETEGAKTVITPNPEIIYHASKNKDLLNVVNDADLIVPDGIGVVFASKFLKQPLPERVGGFDLLCCLFDKIKETDKTVYFLGGKPGVAEKAKENMKEKYPGLDVIGTHDGYFKDEEKIIEEINALSPDILCVCLGFPKQERFMYENKEKLNVKMMIGAGGSLDVLSGNTQRAPKFYIEHNLEWFYRLKKEPKRIGRMMALPKFAIKVLFKGRKYENAES